MRLLVVQRRTQPLQFAAHGTVDDQITGTDNGTTQQLRIGRAAQFDLASKALAQTGDYLGLLGFAGRIGRHHLRLHNSLGIAALDLVQRGDFRQ